MANVAFFFTPLEVSGSETFICQLAPLIQEAHPDGSVESLLDTTSLSKLGSGEGVVVAVIDTGIDLANPQFAAAVFTNTLEIAGDGIDNDGNGFIDDTAGWNMAENTSDTQDIHGHGTKVAWLVMALAPEVHILPVKVTVAMEDTFGSDVAAKAILYAVNAGADIINLSFTSVNESPAIKSAIQYAVASGVLVVGAAGNTGMGVEFPATMDEVIAVGSSTIDETPSWFSPSGTELDIIAPGEDIAVTSLNALTESVSGTSFSAPLVSGAAADLLSMNSYLKPNSLKSLLLNGTMDILTPGFDLLSGYGILNGKTLYAEATPSVYPLSQLQKSYPLSLGIHLPPMDTDAKIFIGVQYKNQIWWVTLQEALEIKTVMGAFPAFIEMNQESVSLDFIFFGNNGVFPSIKTENLQTGKYLWGIFISDMNDQAIGPVGLTEMLLLE